MKINAEQRLYVIESGRGYTCLGFDYAEKRLRAVAAWMGWTPQDIGNATPGTEELSRFWVGKSTGWMPCYLEIKTKRSHGGGAVYLPEGAIIRKIR